MQHALVNAAIRKQQDVEYQKMKSLAIDRAKVFIVCYKKYLDSTKLSSNLLRLKFQRKQLKTFNNVSNFQ